VHNKLKNQASTSALPSTPPSGALLRLFVVSSRRMLDFSQHLGKNSARLHQHPFFHNGWWA